MLSGFESCRASARHWNAQKPSRRNQLASEAADHNYADTAEIRSSDKAVVLTKLKERMAHTLHWEGQFLNGGGFLGWNDFDNGYAADVHHEGFRLYEVAVLELERLAEEPSEAMMNLTPVVEIHGGSPGRFKVKKNIKVGYSGSVPIARASDRVYLKKQALVNFDDLPVEIRSAVMSAFDLPSSCPEKVREEEFDLSMKDPCYIYTACCSVTTQDGNTHTFRSAPVRSSEQLTKTKYSASTFPMIPA